MHGAIVGTASSHKLPPPPPPPPPFGPSRPPPLQIEDYPTPLAHFPLTGGDLTSLLLPAYNGTTLQEGQAPGSTPQEVQASWAADEKFASVYRCNKVGGVGSLGGWRGWRATVDGWLSG